MSEIDELRASSMPCRTSRSTATRQPAAATLNIRWDADADRFWVARVSADTWRRVRTPGGWRIAERINANVDGTAEHREMLAPADE
ncbi:hypothetical protein ACFWCF_14040 [Rhodococcus sp. NPDC060090]|uniref:hypothetical protein n=1 Tax=Rhodococcus sp. NPDC060090 TaxID=3347056 RepID=UPI00366A11D6